MLHLLYFFPLVLVVTMLCSMAQFLMHTDFSRQQSWNLLSWSVQKTGFWTGGHILRKNTHFFLSLEMDLPSMSLMYELHVWKKIYRPPSEPLCVYVPNRIFFAESNLFMLLMLLLQLLQPWKMMEPVWEKFMSLVGQKSLPCMNWYLLTLFFFLNCLLQCLILLKFMCYAGWAYVWHDSWMASLCESSIPHCKGKYLKCCMWHISWEIPFKNVINCPLHSRSFEN